MNISNSQKSVYVIIPVHNRRILTLSCLESLQKLGALNLYSVVVIDDDSTDGTREAIAQNYPNVTVLVGDGSLWWTGAIALGMHYAFEQGAEYVIWLNDDCLPDPQALEILVNYMQSHPGVIVAPACYTEDRQTLIENGCQNQNRLTAQPGEIVSVQTLSGYCVGLSKQIYTEIGTPNAKRFPQYCGDDTYILKATRSGFKAYILGDAKVILANLTEPEHGFIPYIQARFSKYSTLENIFLEKKSRYYIPSQFFYHIEKYGWIGSVLFLGKCINWLRQYYFKLRFQNISFNPNK
jgi:GT2 family glycosyltransferase